MKRRNRYEEDDKIDLDTITIKTKETTITIKPNTLSDEDKEFLDKGETIDIRFTHGNNFVLNIQYKKKYKGKEKWVTVIN